MGFEALGAGLVEAFGAADAVAPLAADVAPAVAEAAPAVADTAITAEAVTPELSASIVPDLSAEAGLGAANQAFGTFNPELFAANTADVATGGFGTDLAASGGGLGDFGVTEGGQLFSGTGLGPPGGFGQVGGEFPSTFDPSGGLTGGQLSDVGNFGGGNVQVAGAQGGQTGSWLDVPGGENVQGTGFGQANQVDSGPIVSNEGIVDTGQIQGGTGEFASRFNAAFPAEGGGQTPELAAPSAETLGATPTASSEFPTVTDQFFNPQLGGVGPNATIETGANVPASFSDSQLNTMAATPLSSGGVYSPTGAVPTAEEAFTPAAAPPLGTTEVPAAPGSVPATPETTNPAAAIPGATPASTAAPAATPAAAAAGGGTDALTALRMGAAGASIVSSGLNIANALNQPAYTALQPAYYPGSTIPAAQQPVVGQYSGQTPLANSNLPGGFASAANQYGNPAGFGVGAPVYNPVTGQFMGNIGEPQSFAGGGPGSGEGGGGAAGTGGITGGLAAGRLTNGLLAGQSPQQLAAEGLISPDRATRLQSDYQGITDQYAQELGVDPRSLSTGVKQMIAARALADSGLGGR